MSDFATYKILREMSYYINKDGLMQIEKQLDVAFRIGTSKEEMKTEFERIIAENPVKRGYQRVKIWCVGDVTGAFCTVTLTDVEQRKEPEADEPVIVG